MTSCNLMLPLLKRVRKMIKFISIICRSFPFKEKMSNCDFDMYPTNKTVVEQIHEI